MSGGNSYSWIGGTLGAWSDAANWEDVTSGQTPAVVAPGSLDVVTISTTGTFTGSGSAASLTFSQYSENVLGDLNLGTLVVEPSAAGSALLFIASGATVSAAAVIDITGLITTGSGSALQVNGPVKVGSPSGGILYAENGALVQTGDLSVAYAPGFFPVAVSTDPSSTIEVGNDGTATAGSITIDPGYTLSGSGQIENYGASGVDIIDNGFIKGGDSLTIGALATTGGQPISPGRASPINSYLVDSLLGTGTVEVQAGGTVNLMAGVPTSGLTFNLDGTASLGIDGPIAAGNTIDMNGDFNTISVGSSVIGLALDILSPIGNSHPLIDATINGFNTTDVLDFLGTITAVSYADGNLSVASAASLEVAYVDGRLSLFYNSSPTENLHINGDYSGYNFVILPNNEIGLQVASTVTCFAAGTSVKTARGERLVEDLVVGELVLAHFAGVASIKWIGQRRIDCRRHPRPEQVWPVRVCAGAVGDNQPRRDLWLSPDHAVFVDDLLTPIKYLVNSSSITQMPVDEFTYYHVELPQHDLLLAEGLLAESYLDVGDRSNFDNADGAIRLFPDFSTRGLDTCLRWEAYGCAPLVVTGEQLDRLRKRLAVRAIMLGYQDDTTPERPQRQLKV
jgi:hypothetical protein